MTRKGIGYRLTLALAATAVLFTASCSGAASPGAPKNANGLRVVKVVFPRAKELAGEDAYLHAAEKLGYAKQNGITFQFESAIGTTDGTKLVTTGQADVTVPSPFVSITARANGLPVQSVWNTLQTNIFCFGVRRDSHIQSIADLKGKKVALGDAGWTTIAAPLLRSAGLSVNDVKWVVAGERRQLAVDQGDVDAVLTWEMEYQNWADQGIDLRTFGQDSVPFQSNGLIMSEQTIKRDPELVKAIVRTASMGAEFVNKNPKAAADIALHTFTGVTPSSDKGMLAVVTSLAGLLKGGVAAKQGYGAHDLDAWTREIEELHADGVISKTFGVRDLVNNDFVTYANGFDRNRIAQDAQNWGK